MIEESAKVNAINSAEGTITVEVQRQSTCGSCSVRNGCGTSVIARALGQRRSLLNLNYSKQDLSVGDTIVLGLSDNALIKGSLAVYTIPLLLMLSFAVLGDVISKQFIFWDASSVDSNSFSVIFSIVGLGLGVMWLRRFASKIKNNKEYQPIVLRKNSLNVVSS